MGKPKPLISSILHPCHHRDSVTEIHCHREATNLKDSQSKQQPSANPGCRKGKRSIVASVDSMHILEINSTMRKSKSGGGKEEVLKEVGNANKKKSPQCWHPKEEEVGGGEAHMGVHCPHTETPVVGETGATCFFAPSPAHPPPPSLHSPGRFRGQLGLSSHCFPHARQTALPGALSLRTEEGSGFRQ